MMPCPASVSSPEGLSGWEPIMVCVFPLPVCPYAIIHTLYLKMLTPEKGLQLFNDVFSFQGFHCNRVVLQGNMMLHFPLVLSNPV